MTYHGAMIDYRLRTAEGLVLSARLVAPALGGPSLHAVGDAVHLHWPRASGVLVPEV
jgi:hypothetical protein